MVYKRTGFDVLNVLFFTDGDGSEKLKLGTFDSKKLKLTEATK